MEKKYIVKLDDNKLAYTAIIIDGVPYIKPLQLLPYTEPDTNEVYQRGYDDAKHECEANIQSNRDEAYNKGHNDGLKLGYERLKSVEQERIDKAYKRGYDDAKHECQDCQKIMADAEQERVDKAYQQGVNDAENRKATCEFCGYVNKGEHDEPCKFCANNYINRFRPRKDNNPIYKSIKDIMDSLDCTISDFEKAIEEIKNEAD